MKKNRTEPAAKRRAAESLFTALGEIDDRYLTEAMEARTRVRKPRKKWHVILPLAASFGLMFTFFTVIAVLLFNSLFSPATPDAPSDGTVQTLSMVLQNCTESTSFTPCENETELPFSDGTIRVIIGDRDGGIWISRPLTEREIRVIRNEYTVARGSSTNFDAPAEEYSVWISYGDGEVWSPCLTSGNGNISFDCLYAYASERDPSDAFINLLTGMTE